jgi:hypothetical protein
VAGRLKAADQGERAEDRRRDERGVRPDDNEHGLQGRDLGDGARPRRDRGLDRDRRSAPRIPAAGMTQSSSTRDLRPRNWSTLYWQAFRDAIEAVWLYRTHPLRRLSALPARSGRAAAPARRLRARLGTGRLAGRPHRPLPGRRRRNQPTRLLALSGKQRRLHRAGDLGAPCRVHRGADPRHAMFDNVLYQHCCFTCP